MSELIYILIHGNVEKDFYTKNKAQLNERNVNTMKLGFVFAAVVNVILFACTYHVSILIELKAFYFLASIWYILWMMLTFVFLDKNHNFVMFFDAILAGTALFQTALAGSLYSQDMCAVTYLVFLIFIPGLYVNRPTCCVTTTVLSGIIFCGMVSYFKTDPYIISVDIINTIFSMVVGIAFNMYSINVQLENIQASVILKEQSSMDELTALPNRRSFNRMIEECFQNSPKCEVNIIMMDIDYFKKYNDTYGHLKGDECLAMVGRELNKTAEKYGAFVARYGGEEFVAIDYVNEKHMAGRLAKSFVADVAALKLENDGSVFHHITISAGYASYPECGAENYMQLINCADEALYKAKNSGRNCVCEYEKEESRSE